MDIVEDVGSQYLIFKSLRSISEPKVLACMKN